MIYLHSVLYKTYDFLDYFPQNWEEFFIKSLNLEIKKGNIAFMWLAAMAFQK